MGFKKLTPEEAEKFFKAQEHKSRGGKIGTMMDAMRDMQPGDVIVSDEGFTEKKDALAVGNAASKAAKLLGWRDGLPDNQYTVTCDVVEVDGKYFARVGRLVIPKK